MLGNGEELSLGLSLTEASSHTPTHDTDYEVSCVGPGGSVTAKASVNIILADDVIKTDLLSEIAKTFDAQAIKNLALEGLEGAELKDFDGEYKGETVSLSENYPDSISMSDAAVNHEHSVFYGYAGNHNFEAYTEQCRAIFDDGHKPLYQKALFNTEILAKTTLDKEFIIPNLYHIKGFEAVTQSLESPIPQGTSWDVSFELSQTKIEYSESFTDFGETFGVFEVTADEGIKPIEISNELRSSEMIFRTAAFPEGYPVPPAKNGYAYDPSHSTCNEAQPGIKKERVYRTAAEFCAPGSHFFGSLQCETGRGLPSRWPYVHTWTVKGLSMDNYIEKFASNRVYKGNTQLKCSTLFPSLARQYGLGPSWTKQTQNNEVLFFNNSRSCTGFNCPDVEARLTKDDPARWNVEPASNYCIDRWKDHPWDSYISNLQALCQGTEVYKEAVAKANQADNDADMIRDCRDSELCKNLVDSIKTVLSNSYFLSSLETKLAEYETAINEAKKAGESYLIPFSDPATITIENDHYLISRLNDFNGNFGINSHVKALREGYSSIIEIHKATKGDWNTVLKDDVMTGISMPKGFQSPEELLATIEAYEKVLGLGAFKGEGLNEIAKPVISKLSCSWEAKGRIRVFSDLKIKSIANEAYEGFSVETKLQSIAPIVIE
ncbi:MAG: hypothetical protein ACOH5I_26350 [Oligoflexus sp.]